MTYYQQSSNEQMQHLYDQLDDEKQISPNFNGGNSHRSKANGKTNHYEADRQRPQAGSPTINAASRAMNEPPSTQLQTDLEFGAINDRKSSNSFTNTITSPPTLYINSHHPDHHVARENTQQNANCTKSTKTTLNVSADVFVPTGFIGYSKNVRSKCKVLDTISEQSESSPDIKCPDDNNNLPRWSKLDNVDVDIPHQLKGMVQVPFDFTNKIIPEMINEEIHDVYSYMNKAMAFNNNKTLYENGKGNIIAIVNFGFHFNLWKPDQPYFCVMKKKENSGKKKWCMEKKLFKQWGIEHDYGIAREQLPSSYVSGVAKYKIEETAIKNVVDSTKWSRVPVYGKRRNKKRRVLHITNEEYIKILKEKSINHNNIIPIISVHDNKVSAENVMIIHLTEDTSIGISYKLESSTNTLQTTGIYLDKDELMTYHQLASPDHKCHCLNDFKSKIDELKIGNVYADQNKIKALQKANKELRDESKKPIIKYIKKVLDDANDIITNNIKTALLSIKHIFNLDTIKQAIENCLKSKDLQPLPIMQSNICASNTAENPVQYLTTIKGNVATTIPLPQSAIT